MSKRRTNVIGTLTEDKLLTASLFDCSINADFFEAWLQQDLLSVLPNGAIVVMGNASFHTSERIQKAVEAAGCLLEHLPPYSPDLNQIEPKWAQARASEKKTRLLD
jgi:transposase